MNRLYVATGEPLVITNNILMQEKQDSYDNIFINHKNINHDLHEINKKEMNYSYVFSWLESNATNYCVDVEITKVNKKYPFSGVCVRTNIGNKNINSNIHPEFETDDDETKEKSIGLKYTKEGNILNTYCQIELEDLVYFYEVEFKIIRGYYYIGDRDYSIRDTIRTLFNERKLIKSKAECLNNCIKLMMNC